jgi:pilus assembly protein Flp/PilA
MAPARGVRGCQDRALFLAGSLRQNSPSIALCIGNQLETLFLNMIESQLSYVPGQSGRSNTIGWNECFNTWSKEQDMKLVARFLKNESGATAIEYGLIAALIAIAIIAGASALGNNLNTTFTDVSNNL